MGAAELPSSVIGLSDRSVRDLLGQVAVLAKQVGVLQSVLAGVAAARSSRERGHGGLVQETGHRNAVEFVREVTGGTRAEAVRAVRVGEALLDGVSDSGQAPVAGGPGEGADAAPVSLPWHEPLRAGLLSGGLTTAQVHAIRSGLGEPPTVAGRSPQSGERAGAEPVTAEADAEAVTADAVVEAWRAAAAALVSEAAQCTVEDLSARARCLRDMLDPAGAEERFQARFDSRSYRSSVGADGLRRGHIVYDDEMGEWVDHLLRTALAPRRGGPRFVAADEKADADSLSQDPRSNDQLAYDLLMDVLRAGARAEAKSVYGAKEPGLRLITLKDTVTGASVHRDVFGRMVATACTQDGRLVLPGSVLERALCVTGTIDVFADTAGNPLDLGREMRLYTAKQRLTLAVRDGGCLWPGCDRPPEYCEAHHCDHWAAGGNTDCGRGVLLCRFHHLHLHNAGWRITRDGDGPFVLHPPAGSGEESVILRSKSPLRWLWDPPPDRERWRTPPQPGVPDVARARVA